MEDIFLLRSDIETRGGDCYFNAKIALQNFKECEKSIKHDTSKNYKQSSSNLSQRLGALQFSQGRIQELF